MFILCELEKKYLCVVIATSIFDREVRNNMAKLFIVLLLLISPVVAHSCGCFLLERGISDTCGDVACPRKKPDCMVMPGPGRFEKLGCISKMEICLSTISSEFPISFVQTLLCVHNRFFKWKILRMKRGYEGGIYEFSF